jgi:hypothetical protein
MMAVHKHAAAKRQYRKGSHSGQVATSAVHPDIWELALILADGDSSRRRVLSSTVVLVRNRGGGAS